jgi:hypothetical protein
MQRKFTHERGRKGKKHSSVVWHVKSLKIFRYLFSLFGYRRDAADSFRLDIRLGALDNFTKSEMLEMKNIRISGSGDR